MRPQHLLRASKSDCYPANVVCLGTQSTWNACSRDPSRESATLLRWVAVWFTGVGGVYDKDNRAEGDTAEQFWEALYELLRKGKAVSIFCERASVACSLLQLWDSVESNRILLDGGEERNNGNGNGRGGNHAAVRVVLENPPFIVCGKMRGAGGRFKILDVANYGLVPSADNTNCLDICERISSFVRAMVSTLREEGLGSLKDTVGTQSMYSFRRKHLTHLVQCHANQRALNLESDGYYGGRCETFRIGRISGVVYHLDVSAMYPYCAATSDVPVSLAGIMHDIPPGDNEQLGEGCGVIADVTVDTNEPAYPYRHIGMGVTIWPLGRFRTTLAGPELQDAWKLGRIVRWHRASWYCMRPALRGFASHILDLSASKPVESDIRGWLKGMGVCLIGKFGQRDRQWVNAKTNVMHAPWATWWESRKSGQWNRFRSLGWLVQMQKDGQWSYDAIPAIAAWVTSLARVRLLRMVRCATWEDTIYCDTDALMVTENAFLRLQSAGWIRDNEPGFLRVKNVSSLVEIHGIKDYDEEGRSVRAGCPLSVAGFESGKVWHWRAEPILTGNSKGQAPTAGRIAIKFDRSAEYRHGMVLSDGRVIPWRLNGDIACDSLESLAQQSIHRQQKAYMPPWT